MIAIQNARLFTEIGEKSRELEIASRHKSQFLASMSHELRTPLNAIIGVTEMLREDAESLKRGRSSRSIACSAPLSHLLTLINDVLDLSKIEAGRMELHLESFALGPLIEDVVKTIEPLAAKNANRIVARCDGAIKAMHADQIQGAAGSAQSHEQRQQVHQQGHHHDRCVPAGARTAATGSRSRSPTPASA